MAIKEYDKIRLKTGERGCILEIFNDGTFLAEVVAANGKVDTTEIKKHDIKAVIVEVEHAV
jgi:hypothetical protein